MAVLEEWLQEKYVENYEEASNYDTALDYMINSKYKKFFQKSSTNEYYFLDSETYKGYYFIEKSNLPDKIKIQIKGGDNSISGKQVFADFNDVYGVTTDLKVFYCSSGNESRIGAVDTAREINLNKVVIPKTDTWAIAMGDEDGITYNEFRSVTALRINQNGLDLSNLMYYPSVKDVTLYNVSYSSLEGIESCVRLKNVIIKNSDIQSLNGLGKINLLEYLFIENSIIGDYSDLRNALKLDKLYFYNITNTELEKLCSENGIGGYDMNIQYLAVVGWNHCICEILGNSFSASKKSSVTDISYFKNLSQKTKENVKYLSIQNNYIDGNLEFLKDFKNLYLLRMEYNLITSLKGIENAPNLTYLYARYNNLGKGLENEENINNSQNSLNTFSKMEYKDSFDTATYVSNMNKLIYVDLVANNDLIWVNYLNPINTIQYLYLADCNSMNGNGLVNIKNILTSCKDYSLPSKYSFLMLDKNTNVLDLTNQTLEYSNFMTLKGNTNISKLRIDNINIIKDNGDNFSNSEINNIINDVLKTMTGVKYLSMNNISALSSIEFVKNVNELIEFQIRDTSVSTIQKDENGNITYGVDEYGNNNGLELLNIYGENLTLLIVNTETIDFSNLQPMIDFIFDKLSSDGYWSKNCGGISCNNALAFKTIEKCSQIHYFGGVNLVFPVGLDLSKCTNLGSVVCGGSAIVSKLPSSLTNFGSYNQPSDIDLSLCKNLQTLSFGIPVVSSINAIRSLPKELTLSLLLYAQYENDKDFSKDLFEAIKQSGCSINEIKFGDGRNKGVTSLNGISNVKGLKKFTVNYYGTLTDIKDIVNCATLEEFQATNCKITDVSFLYGYTGTLKSINLNSNLLYDLSTVVNLDGSIKTYKTAQIFADMNFEKNGNLEKIYLLGNENLKDFSSLKELKWNDKSGF